MRYRHRRREPDPVLTEEDVDRIQAILDELIASGDAWRDQFGVYRHIDEGHAGNA